MFTLNVRLRCRHDKEDYESEIIYFKCLLIDLIKDNFKYFVNDRQVTFKSHYWNESCETWIVPIEVDGTHSLAVADSIQTFITQDPSIRCRLAGTTVSA